MKSALILLMLILIKNSLFAPLRRQERKPFPTSLTIRQTRALLDAYQRNDAIGFTLVLIDIRLAQLNYIEDTQEIIHLLRLRRLLKRIHPLYLRVTRKPPPTVKNTPTQTGILDNFPIGNGENSADLIQGAVQAAGGIFNELFKDQTNEGNLMENEPNGDVVGEVVKQTEGILNAFTKALMDTQNGGETITTTTTTTTTTQKTTKKPTTTTKTPECTSKIIYVKEVYIIRDENVKNQKPPQIYIRN